MISPSWLGRARFGLLTLQVAKASGATVIMVGADGDEERLAKASELGADHVVNVASDDYRQLIADLSSGYGADIVCECSGAGPAAQMLLELVRRGGQYAQIGLFGKPVAWDLDQICMKELSITGSNASVPWAWDRALELIAAGTVKTEPLVTGVYPVTEWSAAFDTFRQRSGLKTLLEPVG